jgi:uncharacterized protein
LEEECEMKVRVTPRASKNRVEMIQKVARVWTSAPPVDGKANASVCEIVAEALKLPKNRVSVVRGHMSRDKTLRIAGLSMEEAERRLSPPHLDL